MVLKSYKATKKHFDYLFLITYSINYLRRLGDAMLMAILV